jgi:hypothetical protein
MAQAGFRSCFSSVAALRKRAIDALKFDEAVD